MLREHKLLIMIKCVRIKELYEKWYHEQREKIKKLQARISALQSIITRMKNKAKENDQPAL